MALCLTNMENILCYFTLISCNKISWWNLVFILRDLGEINGWEEIKFSDSLQLGKFISSPCYKEKKFVNSMEIQRTSLLFTVNLWLLNFFQFDRTLLDFFLFFFFKLLMSVFLVGPRIMLLKEQMYVLYGAVT